MDSKTRRFDKQLLDKTLADANATLQGEYPELKYNSVIVYSCKCSKICNKKFNSIIYYGGAYCKECVNKNKAEKIRNTCTERYGVINPSQLQEIKDKKNETYDKHFGCHPLQSKEIKEKRAAMHMEKYGYENPSQRPEIKEKIKDIFNEKYGGHPMFSDVIKEKVKETCLEKYGVKCPAQNEEVKIKIRETFMQTYGGFPSQNPEIKEKIKDIFHQKYGGHPGSNELVKAKIRETCLEKYGTETPFQNDEVKIKIKQTCQKKYGSDNPMQNIQIMEKTQKSAVKYKKYTLPSGKIINIQGYEHFALNILLQQYSEDQLITERGNIPRISYTFENKNRYYFPDMFIPSENKIIEVKSTWTYSKDVDKNRAKWTATREKGYVCEIWIFNSKGERIPEDNFKPHANAALSR